MDPPNRLRLSQQPTNGMCLSSKSRQRLLPDGESTSKLRAPEEDLEIGDVAFHGEEAYPSEELALAGVSAAQAAERAASNSSVPEKVSEKES